jgi:hypothetical protein
MDFNYQNFIKNLRVDLSNARSIVSKFEDYKYFDNKELRYDDEYQLDQIKLDDNINNAIVKIKFCLEQLKLIELLGDFNHEIKLESGFSEELLEIPYVDVLYSPTIDVIEKYASAICCYYQDEDETTYKEQSDITLLEQILRGTGKLIMDSNLIPSNEAEIRKEIYKILIHVFPMTVREIPIAKVSATFKPDIGIRNLKTAIEYKFIDSANEAKVSIRGVFEDIQGYAGSQDWTKFYAVFYMTDNFLTVDQIKAEFKLSKVKHTWKPILIIGKGGRKTKTTKLPTTLGLAKVGRTK